MSLKFNSQTKKIQKTLKPKAKMTQRRLVLKKARATTKPAKREAPAVVKRPTRKNREAKTKKHRVRKMSCGGSNFKRTGLQLRQHPKERNKKKMELTKLDVQSKVKLLMQIPNLSKNKPIEKSKEQGLSGPRAAWSTPSTGRPRAQVRRPLTWARAQTRVHQ